MALQCLRDVSEVSMGCLRWEWPISRKRFGTNDNSFIRIWLSAVLLAIGLAAFIGACGGGGDGTPPAQAPAQTTTPAGATVPQAGGSTAGGSTVEANAQAETLEDTPLTLNTEQPLPPNFLAAYQRRALIVVEFYKLDSDEPLYPQGLEVDNFVNQDLQDLRSQYPTVEFFSYDITNPGSAEEGAVLRQEEYGTLAAQLEVGYTPFVATLAPRGEQYYVENVFQGYVERGVLDQALFDLTSIDVQGNTSDADIVIEQISLDQAGGVEFFTITNRSDQDIDLQGFSLRISDPETGNATPDSDGVQINEELRVQSGSTVSVGAGPDVTDDDGDRVDGTFQDGEALSLQPQDQLVLLDPGGAVAATYSL